MTPPASTEPMYLISESELTELEIDSSEDTYGCTDGIEIAERIRARGPVAQQAPAECIYNAGELKAFSPECKKTQVMEAYPDINDLDRLSGWIRFQIENRRAHNGYCKESRKTYRKVLKKIDELQSLCHSQSSEHDAALIAQEREKWERGREEDKTLIKMLEAEIERLTVIEAQAREDVLRILADAYQIEDTRPNVSAEYEEGACDALDRVISQVESLRRGQSQCPAGGCSDEANCPGACRVKMQEREPE